MTTHIAIKFDDTGRITNQFIGTKDSAGWTNTQESEWPEANPGVDEIPEFYYDESAGTISVTYKTVQTSPPGKQ